LLLPALRHRWLTPTRMTTTTTLQSLRLAHDIGPDLVEVPRARVNVRRNAQVDKPASFPLTRKIRMRRHVPAAFHGTRTRTQPCVHTLQPWARIEPSHRARRTVTHGTRRTPTSPTKTRAQQSAKTTGLRFLRLKMPPQLPMPSAAAKALGVTMEKCAVLFQTSQSRAGSLGKARAV